MLPEDVLKNLVFANNLSIHSVEDGLEKLKDKDLEVIYIYIDYIAPSCFRKKGYFDISRLKIPTKLNEWIYKNLVDENKYRQYLEKYLPLKGKFKYTDVDEFILQRHYRPKAIKILSARKKFNLKAWTRPRYSLDYRRKTNLFLKDGSNFCFDFRNPLESIFILKENGDKKILAVGGSGGSGQREKYTMFTAIFYLLGKKKKIKYHLLKYNSFNEFEYIKTIIKPIITADLGCNYPLDNKLREEISKNGIEFYIYYKGRLIKNNRLLSK